MAKKIPISFAEDEIDLYKYVKSKRNYSAYIKDLIEEDMKRKINDYNRSEMTCTIRKENDLGLDF